MQGDSPRIQQSTMLWALAVYRALFLAHMTRLLREDMHAAWWYLARTDSRWVCGRAR